MKITQTILEIIDLTYKAHPKDCVFKTGWRNEVIRALESLPERPAKEQFLDVCEEAFRNAEIYCPHEGVYRMPTTENKVDCARLTA